MEIWIEFNLSRFHNDFVRCYFPWWLQLWYDGTEQASSGRTEFKRIISGHLQLEEPDHIANENNKGKQNIARSHSYKQETNMSSGVVDAQISDHSLLFTFFKTLSTKITIAKNSC